MEVKLNNPDNMNMVSAVIVGSSSCQEKYRSIRLTKNLVGGALEENNKGEWPPIGPSGLFEVLRVADRTADNPGDDVCFFLKSYFCK